MKLLFENWRQYVEKEESINEFALPFSAQAKMNKEIKKLEQEMAGSEHASAWGKIKQEMKETKEAWGLAKKYFTKGLSEQEKTVLWDQIKDLAKGTTLATLFAVPGGSVALPLVLKFTKGALVPSAFKEEQRKINIKEYTPVGLHYSKNIPGSVLPDDDDELEAGEEKIKQLKEKGSSKRIRLNLKYQKNGGCA